MDTIAAKAVAFGEILQPEFKEYAKQVQKNAAVLAQALIDRGFTIVSGGTDNHSMLVDLRSKYPDLTGKVAEKALVSADITVNKNMVPFDSRSAFQTSGIRLGINVSLVSLPRNAPIPRSAKLNSKCVTGWT